MITMRKAALGILWTLVLAVPLTAAALGIIVLLTDHALDIAHFVLERLNLQQWAVEGSARWPEVAGMIIGQLVILALLLMARPNRGDEKANG